MIKELHTCERCRESVIETLVEGLCNFCEEERRFDAVERAFEEDWSDDW